jgi:hypothetical protein
MLRTRSCRRAAQQAGAFPRLSDEPEFCGYAGSPVLLWTTDTWWPPKGSRMLRKSNGDGNARAPKLLSINVPVAKTLTNPLSYAGLAPSHRNHRDD